MSFKEKILSKSNSYNYYKNESEKLKKENNKLKTQIAEIKYEKGISVIIPTYKGENHISVLLDSLQKQILSPELFELIFVINGPLDSTPQILNKFIEKNKDFNVIIAYSTTPSVGNARNIGIRIAKREYITFLDDDDYITVNYLDSLYKYSKPNRVVMANFIDKDENTGEILESYVVPDKEKRHGVIKKAPLDFFSLCMVTVAKLIPTYAVKQVEFNPKLKNGVDVSYFGRFFPKFNFEFYFIDKKECVSYVRIKRSNSISRQEVSYEFNVLDRLKVLDDVNLSFENEKRKNYKKFLKKIFNGQSKFMVNYLKEHPDDKKKVISEVKKHDFNYFPYEKLEKI